MQPVIVGEEGASPRARRPVCLMVAASMIALGTVTLIWLVAVPFGSGVCPAIDPPPTSCSASYRAGSGLIATIIVFALAVATVLASWLLPRARRPFAVAGVVLLALAPVVTYVAVAWSPGFPLAVANEPRGETQAVPGPPTDDPVGQWGEIGERLAFLTILDDGTLMGSDGCNGMSGTWGVSDGVVEFSDMISSLVMCPRLESDLHGSVVTAIADGDTIYVLDENGNVSGVLLRAANH